MDLKVITTVPCLREDPEKCTHNQYRSVKCVVPTRKQLELAHLDPQAKDIGMLVEDPEGKVELCTKCGSIRVAGSDKWDLVKHNEIL